MALQGIYDQTIFSKIRQSRLLSYGAAILLVALLTLSLKLLFPYLPLGTFASPYVILIALIAYFIGTGPATLAILLGIAAFAYTISGSSMTQLYRLEIYVWLFTYILGTVLGCVAATLIRNSQHRMISLLNDVKSSEEKYRNLFENINELVSIHEAITDENGQVVDWMTLDVNPMLMDVAGITAKDIIGKPVSQSFGQDPSLSFLIEKVNEMFQSGRPIRFSYYSDLQAKHFNVSAFIMGAKRFAFVFFDITKRKKVEEQLADERSRIEALLKALPVGVMIADSTGRVIEVNDLVKNAWGADFPMAQTLEEYSVYEGWWPDTGKPILPDECPLYEPLQRGPSLPVS
jgi:PAS domain S-box-containing protein